MEIIGYLAILLLFLGIPVALLGYGIYFFYRYRGHIREKGPAEVRRSYPSRDENKAKKRSDKAA